MKYFLERSMFYYFLMREVADGSNECWRFVSECFGIDAETTDKYATMLSNEVLTNFQLSAT